MFRSHLFKIGGKKLIHALVKHKCRLWITSLVFHETDGIVKIGKILVHGLVTS